MAFTAKDGSRHTNRDTMKRADASHGAKMATSPVHEPEEQEPEEGAMDPHQVVDAHGPATEVHIMHGGTHEVHSTHGDGHQHSSQHGSAGEAHDAGKCLSGDCDCGGGM